MNWKDRLVQRLQQRHQDQLWRTRQCLDSAQGAAVRADNQSLKNFCSNDYLGLACHPALIQETTRAVKRYGTGSGAAHLVCGHHQIHRMLEERLAEFVGAPKVVLFSTGYMANLSIPQVFLRRGDWLLQDRQNHASLIDAARLVDLNFKRYPHGDLMAVERILQQASPNQTADTDNRSGCHRMIMTDGVFSMDGDLAPVDELFQLCEVHDALLMVDDAHGLGVMGTRGGGTLQHFGLPISDRLLMVGTLGKSLGSFGAFVAADTDLIEAIIQFARPYIYTTALPPGVAAATLAALDVIEQHPELRLKLHHNINFFRQRADDAGIPLTESITPIQPIFTSAMVGDDTMKQAQLTADSVAPSMDTTADNKATLAFSQSLRELGYWVTAIRPPTVPRGRSRLRITLSAAHSESDIEGLVNALVEVRGVNDQVEGST